MSSAAVTAEALPLSSAIFLVEDEPVLRSSLARGLSRLTNVEVLAAGTVDEAVTFLGRRLPSLLISDIDLPGASGLDLVAELGRREIDVPIILVTAFLKAYQSKIPVGENVLVLEKPISLDELRSYAKRFLRARFACNKRKQSLTLIDYVERTCTEQGSACIEVDLPTGPGRVTILDGNVWSASDCQGCGPRAFQRLAFVPETQLHCGPLVEEPGTRNISVGWERLVLDLACPAETCDDSRSGGGILETLPDATEASSLELLLPAVLQEALTSSQTEEHEARPARSLARTLPGMPQVPPENLRDCDASPSFDELWSLGIDAVLRRNHAAAVRAFSAAGELRPGHPGVLANLRRLEEMGYREEGEEGEAGERN